MPDGPGADEQVRLIAYVKSLGFTDEQIAANQSRVLAMLSHRVLFGDDERVTVAEIAARAGCDESLVRKVRLASGLSDAGDDAVCSPREAEIMASFIVGAAVFGEEVTLQFVRVVGAATFNIAEAAIATFASNRQVPLVERGADLADMARAGVEATSALLVVPTVLDVLLRIQFENAITGRFVDFDTRAMLEVAIGFVDLVESTQLTLSISGEVLAQALSEFEANASDTVVEAGGRIVKRIGDAVMFVTSDPGRACEAAMTILEAVDAHPQLGSARAAVAWGRVLPRDGDYFGPAVNVAARAVPIAEPGTIVVSSEVAEVLEPDSWSMTSLGEQSLKGFDDPVALFELRTRL